MKRLFLQKDKGGAIIMVLVFAGVFLIAVGSLMQFVLQQSISGRGKVAREQALQIAEAGLEYYKWHLANNPSSEWEGTVQYDDPQSSTRMGEFTIEATANKQCDAIMHRDVTVTGTADKDTRFPRTIAARHMLPSVANYSYIFNTGVWMGSGSDTIGPVHANQGIRMDGTHNSTISSVVATWSCNSSYGCSPTQTKDGVWGSGSNPELWEYPDTAINFNDMSIDFADLKARAQADGRYFPSVSGGAGTTGYHLIFKNDGTFDVYEVTSASYNWGWHEDYTITRDYHTIVSESFVGNYTLPSDCSLIFIEDQTWIEGVVSGKVALVVADLVNSYDPDIILHDSIINYTDTQIDGLSAISEHDVLVSSRSPENLTVHGVFSVPNGKFGRNHYVETAGSYYGNYNGGYIWATDTGVGTAQDLGTFTINGTNVASERSGTRWTFGIYKQTSSYPYYTYVVQTSGFANVSNSYERALALDPPPFTPSALLVPYYSNWREE
jgi:hypothetical protein